MTEDKNTLEDKIFALAFLGFCFGFGYWTRSEYGIAPYLQFQLMFPILDGLMRIITLCLGVLVLLGMIMMHFEKRGR